MILRFSSHGVDCSFMKLLRRLVLVGYFSKEVSNRILEFLGFGVAFFQLLVEISYNSRDKLSGKEGWRLASWLDDVFPGVVKVKFNFRDWLLYMSKILLAFHYKAFRYLINDGSVFDAIETFHAMLSDKVLAIRATRYKLCQNNKDILNSREFAIFTLDVHIIHSHESVKRLDSEKATAPQNDDKCLIEINLAIYFHSEEIYSGVASI